MFVPLLFTHPNDGPTIQCLLMSWEPWRLNLRGLSLKLDLGFRVLGFLGFGLTGFRGFRVLGLDGFFGGLGV